MCSFSTSRVETLIGFWSRLGPLSGNFLLIALATYSTSLSMGSTSKQRKAIHPHGSLHLARGAASPITMNGAQR